MASSCHLFAVRSVHELRRTSEYEPSRASCVRWSVPQKSTSLETAYPDKRCRRCTYCRHILRLPAVLQRNIDQAGELSPVCRSSETVRQAPLGRTQRRQRCYRATVPPRHVRANRLSLPAEIIDGVMLAEFSLRLVSARNSTISQTGSLSYCVLSTRRRLIRSLTRLHQVIRT